VQPELGLSFLFSKKKGQALAPRRLTEPLRRSFPFSVGCIAVPEGRKGGYIQCVSERGMGRSRMSGPRSLVGGGRKGHREKDVGIVT